MGSMLSLDVCRTPQESTPTGMREETGCVWEETGCMWARGKWKEGIAVSQQNARKCYLLVEKDRQEPSCLLTDDVCRARVGDDGKFYMNM